MLTFTPLSLFASAPELIDINSLSYPGAFSHPKPFEERIGCSSILLDSLDDMPAKFGVIRVIFSQPDTVDRKFETDISK